MARKPGIPQGKKTGGRQKGTPNKVTTELLQALAQHGCSVSEQYAGLLTDANASRELKLEVLKLITPYLYPQRRAIDPEGYITVEQAASMLSAQVRKFAAALHQHLPDPVLIAQILETVRASS